MLNAGSAGASQRWVGREMHSSESESRNRRKEMTKNAPYEQSCAVLATGAATANNAHCKGTKKARLAIRELSLAVP